MGVITDDIIHESFQIPNCQINHIKVIEVGNLARTSIPHFDRTSSSVGAGCGGNYRVDEVNESVDTDVDLLYHISDFQIVDGI